MLCFSVEESHEEVVKPTWWCVACRDNGVMEIYTLPDFKLVFLVKNFNMAPRVLVDSGSASAARFANNNYLMLFLKWSCYLLCYLLFAIFVSNRV